MRWALIGLLTVHGLVHLMGFAKAFGYAELPQLTQPISRASGGLWLVAGGLVVTAALLAVGARTYWIVGAVALVPDAGAHVRRAGAGLPPADCRARDDAGESGWGGADGGCTG